MPTGLKGRSEQKAGDGLAKSLEIQSNNPGEPIK